MHSVINGAYRQLNKYPMWSRGVTKKTASLASLMALIAIILVVLLLRHCGGRKPLQISADDRRVQDVLDISGQVVSYTERTGRLPVDLSDLREDGSKIPADPVTSKPYSYEISGRDSIRLCADFSSANYFEVGGGYQGDYFEGVWEHGAGRQCLDRNVKEIINGENRIRAEMKKPQ